MKIVLAYSGGLDTSVLLSWLKDKYQAEMVAFCANIGQEEELKGLDKKARQTGASKIYIDDLPQASEASADTSKSPNEAPILKLPISCWGTLYPPGDADEILFEAAPGDNEKDWTIKLRS